VLAARAAAVISVGDGKTYPTIGQALAVAKPGDTIEVYPKDAGYEQVALRITTPRLTIRGVGPKRIILGGQGFDYSGVGSIPRAIVQLDPGADQTTIQHFELVDAHNDSYNGAGVRINQANRVIVRDCDIHDCDMGIMSNGKDGDPKAASDQDIDSCVIHENGSRKDPGYNHNLYLGGTSVTVERCNIYGALTGHNLKSRAHFTLVRYCWIHDSANRELDFVEAWDTERPNSNAVLIGDMIAKDPNCTGNRMTINFGREKGKRDGTLFLINDTIVTPFQSGVVGLSSAEGSVKLLNNVIVNTQQSGPSLIDISNGASLSAVTGSNNWMSREYNLSRTLIDAGSRFTGATRQDNPLDPQMCWSAAKLQPAPAAYVDGNGQKVTVTPNLIYIGDGRWMVTKARFIGAG